jgi:serine/threonine protein kinase
MTKPFTNETAPAIRHMTDSELVQFSLADDYEIIEELGRGGMAIVYRAREKALDRDVAIKVLPARLVIDQGFVERFEHEARTAAKLEHPNIVPIYRVGRAGPNGEVIYFVMKLLRGQSLSSVMAERGKVEPSDVRRILTEVASALNYAAKSNVVHRDIKPDNIMLDSEGRCVVTDFGIAKAPGGQQTTAGTSLGTPRYMSPEHAMGQQLDGRSDMYSLGIVAYQCLFGKAPFEADEPFAVLYKHIHDPLPEPTLDNDEARQLYPIIARMLAKRPSDRYQTGNELIAALGGQTSDPSLVSTMLTSPGLMAPTEVMPTPKPWSISRWRMLSRTRKIVWSTVGVAAVATVFAVVITPAKDGNAENRDGIVGSPGSATNAAASPLVPGPADSTRKSSDSAAVPPKPKGPSDRAAAILAYNKLKSACPTRRDTNVTTPEIRFAVMLDPVADRARAETMSFSYDVCGLAKSQPFTAKFVLTKDEGRISFRPQGPIAEDAPPNTTNSPRSRERFTMRTAGASAGSYTLDLIVINAKKDTATARRQFRITDK